ncbi:MAG: ATP-binding cassette domain-containing protein [Alcanivorax sp.]|nr:ATP-binding cassette domain-containing protein [Alcanivorax sp.]
MPSTLPDTAARSSSLSGSAALHLQDVAIGTLTQVTAHIAAGEILCLSGTSGSGKSRLLRAIADLDPHGGEIHLGDHIQGKMPGHSWRREVMLVPAETQWWHDTVAEHLGPAMDEQALQQALTALGFAPDTLHWQVSRLSSGEKQRLALLRAISHRPGALLLDEPTANLDGDTTLRTEQWLQDTVRYHALPTLWVAHDPAQIARVADRHMHIEGHRLVQQP